MKNVSFFTLLIFIFAFSKSNAQTTPPIQWQKSLGGSGDDYGYQIHQTTDGGYIVIGYTNSIDGDVTGHGNPYSTDLWVAKLNSLGNIVWENAYGGFDLELYGDIEQTSDGGFIFTGTSYSNDVYVTGNHGGGDFWVVKLDAGGNILWEHAYGGNGTDKPNAIKQSSDGGFIICGTTTSTNGDITSIHGEADAWIVKLSSAGTIQWQKNYGGTSADFGNDVIELPDGNFVFAGYTYSNDGDITSYYGNGDAWLAKINGTSGNLIWSHCYGGSDYDAIEGLALTQDATIGLVAVGSTASPNDFNVTGNHGGYDMWLMTLDVNTGIFNFAQCYGGSAQDVAYSVDATYDQGYLITGYTYSINGDVTNQHGSGDFWAVKINRGGTIDWQRTSGGSDFEGALSGEETSDGGYVMGGFSASNDGEVTGNHGLYDFWIAKLDPCFIPPASTAYISPNTLTCGGSATMSVPGGIPYSYQWKKNGNNVSGANGKIFTASVKGNYTCVVSNGACGSITSSNTIQNQKQVATISPTGTVNKCSNDKVNFSANTGSGLTYQWYNGSNALAGATNSTYSTKKTGKFKVTVYNTGTACTATSTITTVNNVCREESIPAEELIVNAFPNPANNELQIQIADMDATLLIQFYSINGKLMTSFTSEESMNTNSCKFNTSTWENGIYLCNVISDNDVVQSFKVVIQH